MNQPGCFLSGLNTFISSYQVQRDVCVCVRLLSQAGQPVCKLLGLYIYIPVEPHEAVAEVSRIGNV